MKRTFWLCLPLFWLAASCQWPGFSDVNPPTTATTDESENATPNCRHGEPPCIAPSADLPVRYVYLPVGGDTTVGLTFNQSVKLYHSDSCFCVKFAYYLDCPSCIGYVGGISAFTINGWPAFVQQYPPNTLHYDTLNYRFIPFLSGVNVDGDTGVGLKIIRLY